MSNSEFSNAFELVAKYATNLEILPYQVIASSPHQYWERMRILDLMLLRGEQAVIDLAGFIYWAEENLPFEQPALIRDTLRHDLLTIRTDADAIPRSQDHGKFFVEKQFA